MSDISNLAQSPINSGIDVPKRDTIIDHELAVFNDEVSRLEQSFSSLANRLLPILNTQEKPGMGSEKKDPQEILPQLAEKIRELRLKVRYVGSAINEIESRVEL